MQWEGRIKNRAREALKSDFPDESMRAGNEISEATRFQEQTFWLLCSDWEMERSHTAECIGLMVLEAKEAKFLTHEHHFPHEVSKRKEFGNLIRTAAPAKPTELQNNFSQGISGVLKCLN